MRYGCVLDDNLLKEFFAFQRGQNCNADVIGKLLRLYHPHYLSCYRQLTACEIDDEAMNQQLLQSGHVVKHWKN
jgi:hypothetical protein